MAEADIVELEEIATDPSQVTVVGQVVTIWIPFRTRPSPRWKSAFAKVLQAKPVNAMWTKLAPELEDRNSVTGLKFTGDQFTQFVEPKSRYGLDRIRWLVTWVNKSIATEDANEQAKLAAQQTTARTVFDVLKKK